MSEQANRRPVRSRPPVVVGVFEDEVRAEQAVRALEVWRSANRRVGVGPIGVVARRLSGALTWRARGVARPVRGALWGVVAGGALFALPTAGAVFLATWVLGSIAFGLGDLVGAVPAEQVGGLVLATVMGSVTLFGMLAGLVGALVGCLVGLLVCFVDRRIRGLTRSEVALTAAALHPGAWAAVARVQAAAEPLVRDELARLGATPAGGWEAAGAARSPIESRDTARPAGSTEP
jgi:hypothetical protein